MSTVTEIQQLQTLITQMETLQTTVESDLAAAKSILNTLTTRSYSISTSIANIQSELSEASGSLVNQTLAERLNKIEKRIGESSIYNAQLSGDSVSIMEMDRVEIYPNENIIFCGRFNCNETAEDYAFYRLNMFFNGINSINRAYRWAKLGASFDNDVFYKGVNNTALDSDYEEGGNTDSYMPSSTGCISKFGFEIGGFRRTDVYGDLASNRKDNALVFGNFSMDSNGIVYYCCLGTRRRLSYVFNTGSTIMAINPKIITQVTIECRIVDKINGYPTVDAISDGTSFQMFKA